MVMLKLMIIVKTMVIVIIIVKVKIMFICSQFLPGVPGDTTNKKQDQVQVTIPVLANDY